MSVFHTMTTPSSDQSCCDCDGQARERRALAPCEVGLAEIDVCGHCDAVFAFDRIAPFEGRLSDHSCAALNALQLQDLAFWLVWA